MSAFRDRIKELRRVRAGDLKANPSNWRTHPPEQRSVLEAILSEIGYADACLARELDNGDLELIDGHLRADLDPEQEVPVLVLDVTEQEASKLLAVLDPIAMMAQSDEAAQRRLLSEIEADEAELRRLIDEMLAVLPGEGEEAEVDDEGRSKRDLSGPAEMLLKPHEHYDYVLVLAKNTREWNRLMEVLELPYVTRRMGKIGVGRAILASELLRILETKDGNAADRGAE